MIILLLFAVTAVFSECTKTSIARSGSAEEIVGGSVNVNSKDLDFFTTDDGLNLKVALRFENLGTFDSAQVDFLVQHSSDADLSILIEGELSANSEDFTSSLLDVTSRTTTAVSHTWNVANIDADDTISTPDISDLINEIASLDGYSGTVVLIFTFTSGSGSAVLEPVLQLTECIPQASCATLNFCCVTSFDGQYVRKDSRLNGKEVWERSDGVYAIWWETFTTLNGEEVNDARWVVGSMSDANQPFLVSDYSGSESPLSPLLDASWIQFQNLMNLYDGTHLDCSANWQGCDACIETLPPSFTPTMLPSGAPVMAPNTDPSHSPTQTPTNYPTKSDSCSLSVILEVCDDDNSGTMDPVELEACSGPTCMIYATELTELETGASYVISYDADDFLETADSIQVVAQSQDAVCLVMSAVHNFQTVRSDETWLDQDCEASANTCPCGSYPYDGFVYSCETTMDQVAEYSLWINQEVFLTTVPVGTIAFSITLTATVDFDLKMYEGTRDDLGDCLTGFGCIYNGAPENTQSVFVHDGMAFVYSGDKTSSPARESILIPSVTMLISFQIKAFRTGSAEVAYSWEAVEPCDLSEIARCEPCESYGCGSLNPVCDGSYNVQCVKDSEVTETTCDGYDADAVCSDVLTLSLPECSQDGTPPPETTSTKEPTLSPSLNPTLSPTTVQSRVDECEKTVDVLRVLYDTCREGCFAYTGSLPDSDVSLDSVMSVDTFVGTEYADAEMLVESGGELYLDLGNGLYRRTCVAYSSTSTDECDSSQSVCSVEDSVGTSDQILTSLMELRTQDSMHPDCPTGCSNLPSWDVNYYANRGMTEAICDYNDEFYFVEDDGSKSFTCVGSGSEFSECPANEILCGGFNQGIPRYASFSVKSDLLQVAAAEESRRHPYCPNY